MRNTIVNRHALSLTAIAAAVAFSATASADITEAEVVSAQKAWGDAVVMLSAHFDEGGVEKARSSAREVIDAAYGYNMGPVLFKPTLAPIPQNIRLTADGALAYFVGHDDNYPEDSGFGIKGWTKVEFENAAIHFAGPVALTMGNVHFTNTDGSITTVDKSFGYQRDDEGNLRIVLHHSSLPFGNQ
ncbi:MULTISPECIES: hypothetical protein [Marinobacter]|uniref:hypothetical protein n=1 Tax=Marinobacter TaxID=2742 RepID=UPI002004291B|nr:MULTISPECIES: hypothetical protein [Marinobacter]MCK7552706.1 hypothetical protein [Marinobacter goseongensis]MDV3505419.1 hypothetical protein [Marinobacter sp. M-5]